MKDVLHVRKGEFTFRPAFSTFPVPVLGIRTTLQAADILRMNFRMMIPPFALIGAKKRGAAMAPPLYYPRTPNVMNAT